MPKCKYRSIRNKITKEKRLKRIKIRKRKENLPFSESFLFSPFLFWHLPNSAMAHPSFTLPLFSLSAVRDPLFFFLLPLLFLRPSRSSRAPRARPNQTQKTLRTPPAPLLYPSLPSFRGTEPVLVRKRRLLSHTESHRNLEIYLQCESV